MLFSPTEIVCGPVSWARSATVERECRLRVGLAAGTAEVEVEEGAEGRLEVVWADMGAGARELVRWKGGEWRCGT